MLQQVIIGVFGVLLCWSSAFGAVGVFGRYDYRAFGEISSHTGATSKYLFTGEQYDSAADSYYLRARYYNPSAGRFLSGDKYKFAPEYTRELNGYGYVAANPVNATDPSGEFALIGYGQLTASLSAGEVAAIAAEGVAAACTLLTVASALRDEVFTAKDFGRQGNEILPIALMRYLIDRCQMNRMRVQLQQSSSGRTVENNNAVVVINLPVQGVLKIQLRLGLLALAGEVRPGRLFPTKNYWKLKRCIVKVSEWITAVKGGVSKIGQVYSCDTETGNSGQRVETRGWRIDVENDKGWNLRR